MKIFLKYRKQLIIAIVMVMITTVITGIYILHSTFKNINYSKSEAHVIALNQFPGTIISSKIEYEDWYIYYELEIKNTNQEIIEVTVSAKNGTIVGYEYEGVVK